LFKKIAEEFEKLFRKLIEKIVGSFGYTTGVHF
jgi:hypothetical protein